MWKRRMLSLGLGLAILCALFLPAQIRVWKSQSALNNLQSQKQALYLQQQQIQRQIGYYNSAAYVEEAARQNLGLVNPGESLVLPAVAGKAMPLAQTYHSSAIGPYGD
jgi:cell division protein FtsB